MLSSHDFARPFERPSLSPGHLSHSVVYLIAHCALFATFFACKEALVKLCVTLRVDQTIVSRRSFRLISSFRHITTSATRSLFF